MRHLVNCVLISSVSLLMGACTRIGALCSDGTTTTETGPDACSLQGGIDQWQTEPTTFFWVFLLIMTAMLIIAQRAD
ncbi:MAG TPA: hypothetical protein EYN93_06945 [Planctomycetaceae bacterium]|nr:hypothetical protein [Planctomycetaceae bacterium]